MGTVHRFERTIPHSRNVFATSIVAAIAFHPVETPADAASMTPDELLYFTDSPVAHVAAMRDFERDLHRERRARQAPDTRFQRTPGELNEREVYGLHSYGATNLGRDRIIRPDVWKSWLKRDARP